jgi:hypothetical protein
MVGMPNEGASISPLEELPTTKAACLKGAQVLHHAQRCKGFDAQMGGAWTSCMDGLDDGRVAFVGIGVGDKHLQLWVGYPKPAKCCASCLRPSS